MNGSSAKGSETPGAGLDVRRRRTHFRAWHRGMRETDLILGRFADAEIANLTDDEMDAFEALLDELDRDILAWLTGEASVPEEVATPLFLKLAAFTGATLR
ncbi:antitoxin CptB [Kaistia hirudinis]|uniref:FAD assembly factor SdhE n=1 Tax=Kaistia hirudinis TaxID=1293440 RepID=A0A840AJ06_9HYPH|nr:succinate dehydrogenase assembly factor 2 [Kaistia hirudinis]MBB3929398.1 antitoxin CptB [Kaistia hirudinis]MBN9018578.1 succinate dehydrogenase assembly factor 2 [Hyphomicrobiales bacterium]